MQSRRVPGPEHAMISTPASSITRVTGESLSASKFGIRRRFPNIDSILHTTSCNNDSFLAHLTVECFECLDLALPHSRIAASSSTKKLVPLCSARLLPSTHGRT